MTRTVTQLNLEWTAAQAAVRSAAEKAAELGVAVNVSVADASGLPLAFARINGAPIHSISIAEDKAATAASFGLATGDWHDEVGSVLVGGSQRVEAVCPTRHELLVEQVLGDQRADERQRQGDVQTAGRPVRGVRSPFQLWEGPYVLDGLDRQVHQGGRSVAYRDRGRER